MPILFEYVIDVIKQLNITLYLKYLLSVTFIILYMSIMIPIGVKFIHTFVKD